MELLAHNANAATSTTATFDTDGIPVIIDNSATGAICNESSLFVGTFKKHTIALATADGVTELTKNVGTLRLVLRNDAGKDHTNDVPGVVYDPDSPYSLLVIPFLGALFVKRADSSQQFDDGTWILSRSTSSHFTWNHCKQKRHFQHANTDLPELWL